VKPRLLNLAAGVSFSLCAAIAILWALSYWRSACLSYASSKERLLVAASTNRGRLEILTYKNPNDPRVFSTMQGWSCTARLAGNSFVNDGQFVRWHFLGFAWSRFELGDKYETFVAFVVPCWSVVLGTSLLPLLALRRRHLSRHRRRAGLCPTCGYDLRATPDRCPECGTAAPPVRAVT
jgi:hypothetical protein